MESNYIYNGLLLAAFLFPLYLLYVQYRRYENICSLIKKYPDPEVILQNSDIAMEIYGKIFRVEFPTFARASLEFALFKTFAAPSISKLLVATREFREHAPRRIEDTELILSELIDIYSRIQNELVHGRTVTEEGIALQYARREASFQRLNELHGKYHISNDDYLFTLYLFAIESIRWINQWEWRKLDVREENAIFKVWYDIGKKMNIQNIPDTLGQWQRLRKECEKTMVKYHPNNWECAESSINHLALRLPPGTKFVLFSILPCVLEDSDCIAFNLQPPSATKRALFNAVMYIRSWFIRHLCLPRSKPCLRTPFYPNKEGRFVPLYFMYKPEIYKDGYRIEELGPERFMPKCPHFKS
ncbi:hypothetical protein BY458DRAFT_499131 [Sporodiniella umbellata]|nr:hypothetical protein BY458DRAFT_499131 [Sporodiniella umbellata]